MNARLIAIGESLQPYFLLLIRLFWGWAFLSAGLGKVMDIAPVAAFFGMLGIPLPLISAYAAGTVELVGGAFLLVGFAARWATLPLMVTMLVALLTAHREATLAFINDPLGIVVQLPFTFLLVCFTIFVFGAGKFSIDHVVSR